jgi:ATP adenylyltransferase
MERLWSPWRLSYVSEDKTDTGCVFCHAADPAAGAGQTPQSPATDSLIVHRGRTCYVMLNLYPYNSGHVMVVPCRHVSTLGGLQPDELQELAVLTQLTEAVLTEAYRPHGLNVGINLGKSAGAGILEHIHVHAVPRWAGDSNFMTVVGETRVLPEDPAATARRLRPVFARLGSLRS